MPRGRSLRKNALHAAAPRARAGSLLAHIEGMTSFTFMRIPTTVFAVSIAAGLIATTAEAAAPVTAQTTGSPGVPDFPAPRIGAALDPTLAGSILSVESRDAASLGLGSIAPAVPIWQSAAERRRALHVVSWQVGTSWLRWPFGGRRARGRSALEVHAIVSPNRHPMSGRHWWQP